MVYFAFLSISSLDSSLRLHNTRYTENIDGHVTLMVIVSGMGGFAERLFGRADIAEVYWEKDELSILHTFLHSDCGTYYF
jgi:hypothetical protein